MNDRNDTSAAAAKPRATDDEKPAAGESEVRSKSKFGAAPSDTEARKPPRRIPKHVARGGIAFVAGALVTFVLMANEAQIVHGPLYGAITLFLAVLGLLDALGLFLPKGDALPLSKTALGQLEGEPAWMAPQYGAAIAFAILVVGSIFAGYEALPYAIVAALVALLPAALRRPALLVFVIVSLIYLPLLGTYALWDPWETHYGEVAREILARDDWISLWWAQENWFWSKPILIFWTEALTMGGLGVAFAPDANPAFPEWALRLPIYLMSIGAVLAVYAAIARTFSRRAGVLSALVLATMPHFFFLAHQAITDMPFVANMTIAMSLLVIALAEDPDRPARVYSLGKVRVSAQHLVLGAIAIAVLPQALYLISRNVTFYTEPFGFAFHGDEFMYGSAGNPSVPGNPAPYPVQPYVDGIIGQPALQGVLWLAGLGLAAWIVLRERRVQQLLMFGFYFFCALAFMGKGIPGFALPGMVALLYLVASRRWSLLWDGKLRIAAGALIIAVVGLPWYVAMYVRHGPPFTDRLLVHDHINRLAAGVHGDNGSIEYFLEQLGYATFPWVALIPAAVLGWLWYSHRAVAHASPDEGGRAGANRIQTLMIFGLWFFGAFTLFSAMITKFHHYIFPAVPPAAVMVGVLLDRMFGPAPQRSSILGAVGTVLAVLAAVPIVLGIAGLWGDVRGILPPDLPMKEQAEWVFEHPWNPFVARGLVVLGALMLVAAAWRLGREASDASTTPSAPAWETHAILGALLVAQIAGFVSSVGLALAVVVFAAVIARVGRRSGIGDGVWSSPSFAIVLASGAVLASFVGRDLSWATDARPQGYERLIHLFVYNYGRPWPDHFDYRPILTGFAIASGVVLSLAVLRSARPIAARALVGIALLFAAWTLDVYMVDLSPHWGQRELIKRYYEERGSAEEPLVAWQMNWKGENFYTGNRVAVFVDLDNQKLRQWIGENHGRRAFFVLEHGRLGTFRGLLPGREVREITTKRENNKFILVEATL